MPNPTGKGGKKFSQNYQPSRKNEYRRDTFTRTALKYLTADNVIEWCDALMQEIRNPGPKRLKALEIFANNVFRKDNISVTIAEPVAKTPESLSSFEVEAIIEEDNATD